MDGGQRLGITDAERQAVVATLQRRAALGQIDEDELTSRVSRARTAMTRAGLDGLLMDLPPDPDGEWFPAGAAAPTSSPTSAPPWADLEPGTSSAATPRTAPTPPIAGPTSGTFPPPPGSIDRAAAGAEMMRVSHLAPMLITLVVVAVVGMTALLVAGSGGDEPDGPSTAVEDPEDPIEETATTLGDPVGGGEPTTIPTTPGTEVPEAPEPPAGTVPPLPDLTTRRLRVGTDIAPGRYVNTDPSTCYWERLDGSGEIIVNGNGGRVVLDLQAGDAELLSRGCGKWRPYAPPPQPATSLDDGDWLVGADVAPGTYRSDAPAAGPDDLCAWERARGFSHDHDEIIEFAYPAPREVTLGDGERFTSYGCGTWTKV